MEVLTITEGTHWYAVYTKAKEEERADYNLRGWNVETYSPKITENHRNQFTGRIACHIKSLFPRYIFARFDAEKLLHKVNYTRGVHSVVSSDHRPLLVDDEIIDLIKSKAGVDGYIKLEEEMERGCRVVIKGGSFRGLNGVFEESTKSADRVVILLDSINYQARVTVDRELVRRERPAGNADDAPRERPAPFYDGVQYGAPSW